MRCSIQNSTIRNTTADDFDWIKNIWYKNRDTLSIPFTRCITEMCADKNCYIFELEGNAVAVGQVRFYKRAFEIRVEHLVVDEKYRGNGIGTVLLRHLISSFVMDDCSLIEPDIVAFAVVGAKNNTFYDRLAIDKTTVLRKTKTLYKYRLCRRSICDEP